jgi:translocation and assembly module TamA
LIVALALSAPTPSQAFDFFGLFGKKGEEEAQPVIEPTPYVATLKTTDSDLRDILEEASLLIDEQEKVPSGAVGLLARARNDRQRLIATLYQEGRYGGTVQITVNGMALDQIPVDANLRGSGAAQVVIDVDPGPQFTFGKVEVTGADDASVLPELGLVPGQPARSALILKAERELVEDWKTQGHPFAKAGERQIVANHRENRLDVALHIDPGPAARFGAVEVRGAKDVDAQFIARQAAIPAGAPYDPDALRKAAKRLRELELFDSIVIREGGSLAADGTLPVTITVSERKPRVIGIGVTASNTDGAGVEAYWVRRNLFGSGEQLRFEGAVGRIGQGGQLDDLDLYGGVLFSKPGLFGPENTFTSKLAVEQENTDAYSKKAFSGEVALLRRFSDVLTGSVGAEFELARIRDVTGTDNYFLAGVPVELIYDTRDSVLDPTRGINALVFVEPLYDFENGTGFLVTKGSLAMYKSLDPRDRLILAGRIAGGSIFGTGLASIPADRRFYAGGGGSIRGYAYQAASPRTPSGELIGGRSFAEGTVEARVRVTDEIGIVPFFDLGGAYLGTTPGDGGTLYSGAGVGFRYLTPIGPLRLDVAVPLKKIAGQPDYGLYLGLGQAF